MNIAPVFSILGVLLTILSFTMLIPMFIDIVYRSENWFGFASASLISCFIGISLWLTNRNKQELNLGLKEAFLLTNFAWILSGIFGALPFVFSDLRLGFTDAIFESISGITTTGSTILQTIELASPGIILWRALLQWLGGIGIIVMALAILPVLSVGGMQLFKTETYEASDNAIPRARQLAGGIFAVYTTLTLMWAFMLWLAGMTSFDALIHSMTTLATGGYSSKTSSIGAFDSIAIEVIIMSGMIAGSLPFAHYLAITRGGWHALINDPQVRWFLVLTILVILLITIDLGRAGNTWLHSIRLASFNTISVITGTGYGTANFALWGGFSTTMLLIMMFMGGCAGSTTCGIKMFRLQVLVSTIKVQIARLLRPHGVVLAYYNNKPVPESVMDAVMGFFYLYILCFVFLSLFLAFTGLDFTTAFSGAATAISNVGPGLGEIIGPNGSFNPIPDMAKWAMCFGMLLGRLELFTILVMLNPLFWRN